MQSINFTSDYIIVTLSNPDNDQYQVEGQIQGQPLFLAFVEGNPLVQLDTKVIPEPAMEGDPSTQLFKPAEGYVLEAELENDNHLSIKGKKLTHCPPFGIYS